jgi:dolichyl-phosphate-mannose--protein O-mannosyl transferase
MAGATSTIDPVVSPAAVSQQPQPKLRLRRDCLALLLLALAVAGLHSHSFRLGFWFDDYYHLERCCSSAGPNLIDGNRFEWAGRIAHVWWVKQEMSYAYFRPLTIALRAAWLHLFGLNPLAFHAVHLALHFLTVALLHGLVRRCGGSVLTGWLAAFLFTLHPVQAFTVGWLSNDGPVLVGFWTLLGLWCVHAFALSGHRRWRWGAAILAC